MEVDGRLALEQLEDLPRLVVREQIVVEEIDLREAARHTRHQSGTTAEGSLPVPSPISMWSAA